MILIFGGTTEGRIAVEVCEQAGKPFYYSTKGAMQQVEMHNGVRLTGALSAAEISDFCRQNDVRCIVDAAHPFAVNLHHTIAQAGMPVIRLQRSFGARRTDVTYCTDYADAVTKMNGAGIRCLLALSGANTITQLRGYWEHHKTVFRILNRADSIEKAILSGFPTSNLVFYDEGNTLPTQDEERCLMQQLGCDAMITKESGESGGFDAKVDAAVALGMKVFVVEHPALPDDWVYVGGGHGLRRAIESMADGFFPLRTGLTTGACATAATKAALLSLLCDEAPDEVSFALPDGEVLTVPVAVDSRGVATVVKDFSDDPDVTKGCRITARVEKGEHGIRFLQGDGVGVVTLPGLGIPVGEPAVNPTPRRMIEAEIRSLSDDDYDVTISVENGREIALKTFNAKVGVVGGISIIGTSGIVSPLSNEAFVSSIRREMEVARAIGCRCIGLVSGKKAEEALKGMMDVRCIHYGNFVGESLKIAAELGFERVVLAIMIGKAVKLAEGNLDTHSHKVAMNKAFLKTLAAPADADRIDGIAMARDLWNFMPPTFFEEVVRRCYDTCVTVFPHGDLKIELICEKRQ